MKENLFFFFFFSNRAEPVTAQCRHTLALWAVAHIWLPSANRFPGLDVWVETFELGQCRNQKSDLDFTSVTSSPGGANFLQSKYYSFNIYFQLIMKFCSLRGGMKTISEQPEIQIDIHHLLSGHISVNFY